MDFGKNILSKFGWKEGEGLGKDKQGIINPLRAKSNFENQGLGHSASQAFTNHWWERVFNESASNLNVNKNSGDVTFGVKDPDGVEITSKSYSVKKLKDKNVKMTYGSFLKSATLLADVGKEEDLQGHVKTEDIAFNTSHMMADEDLLKACGGRTAHKGARHGLNLRGKLSRVEEQDAILLEKLQNGESYKDVFAKDGFRTVKAKKSKNKCQPKKFVDPDQDLHPEEEEDELSEILNNNNKPLSSLSVKKAKKERKLEKELSQNIYTLLQSETMTADSEPTPSKSNKKKKGKKRKEGTSYELKTTISKKARKAKNRNLLTKLTVSNVQAADFLKDNLITAKQLKKMQKKGQVVETPKEDQSSRKRKFKIDSDTSSSDDEDTVERINQEQERLHKSRKSGKHRRVIPTSEFESEHLEAAVKVSKKTKRGNRKKSKNADKMVKRLADSLAEVLSSHQNSDEDL